MTLRLRPGPRQRHAWGGHSWGPLQYLGVGAAALAVAAVPFALGWWGSSGSQTGGPVRIESVAAGDIALRALPPTPQPFLDSRRIVSFYGNPLAPQMGILGEYPPDEVIRRLKAQAEVYQRLSPERTVVPAVHMVYAVAQEKPGAEGLYLVRMEDELVWQWIRLTQREGVLLFLDIQFGRSTIDKEFPHVAPFLREPNVHLALDPEFAWGPDEFPLIDIGHLDGAVVNRAQDLLEALVRENRLSNKVLVVHQFRRDMLTNKAAIRPSEWVETVIDADGFGSPGLKLDQWNQVIVEDNVRRAGIKLFYKQDAKSGGLLSEADVMGLTPAPVVIIYQ